MRLPLAKRVPQTLPGHRLLRTRRPGADPHAALSTFWNCSRPAPPETRPAFAVGFSILGFGGLHLLGRNAEQDHVVDDVGIARQHVGAGQPAVLLQLGIEQEASVVIGPGPVGADGVYAADISNSMRVSPARSGLGSTGFHPGMLIVRGAPFLGIAAGCGRDRTRALGRGLVCRGLSPRTPTRRDRDQ